MQFTTPVPIREANDKITYESSILSLGSCFAENIADKLRYFKFNGIANPFGIIFHPLAINDLLTRAANNQPFTEKDILHHNGRFHSFSAHSDLSADTKETLLDNLNTALTTLTQQILRTSHIIITYGTAWAYRHTQSDTLVANCHKIPQTQFTKELLTIPAIEHAIQQSVAAIHKLNPATQVIFTISPVRHIKDGFPENQRSKAHLIAALHQTLAQQSEFLNPKSQILNYFPAYEILLDELRDYRFYAPDMLHPSQTAIDYIWQRFTATWISKSALHTMEEVAAIQSALLHRPFNPDSDAHRKFLTSLNGKITALTALHPNIKW